MAEQIKRPDEPLRLTSKLLVEHMQFHGHNVELIEPEETEAA